MAIQCFQVYASKKLRDDLEEIRGDDKMPPEINEKKKGQRFKKPALDRKKKNEGDDN